MSDPYGGYARCPICNIPVLHNKLNQHMKTHSKNEIVSALLMARGEPDVGLQSIPQSVARPAPHSLPVVQTPAQPIIGLGTRFTYQPNGLPPGSNVVQLPQESGAYTQQLNNAQGIVTPHGLAPQVVLPPGPAGHGAPMMVQVMSPVIVPQPNGAPPLIVNMPGYLYPNVGLPNNVIPPNSAPQNLREAAVQNEPAVLAQNQVPVTQPEPESAALPPEVPEPPEPQRVPPSLPSRSITVKSVKDLEKILYSGEEDVQVVVGQDLMESEEFKNFVLASKLFSTAIPAVPQVPKDTSEPATPFNTPAPGSPASAEKVEVDGSNFKPVPGPSKNTREKEDDDISMHDLIALETMEEDDEIEEEDRYFSSHRFTSPLGTYMNDIRQEEESLPLVRCDGCSAILSSHEEVEEHNKTCPVRKKKGVGKKSKKVKKPSVVDNVDDNAIMSRPSSRGSALNTIDVRDIKTEHSLSSDQVPKMAIKSEITHDSASQPALGAYELPESAKFCSVCNVTFDSGSTYLEHLEELKKAKHKCYPCHMVFEERRFYQAHKKKHHADEPDVKTEQNPDELIKEELVANIKGEYECDRCSRAFREKDLLLKHMSCHIEDKPHECLECGKKFMKPAHLKDHRRRHFEVGSHTCQYCQKAFFSQSKLVEHVRVHTGEAPLSCPICGKRFKRHSNLSEHKQTHLENRPSKPLKELFCHCGKVFSTQRDLDWHKEGVHDNIPKKCKFCGEVFVHSTSLTRHIRQKHEANFVPDNKKSNLYSQCPICHQTFYKTSIHKHIRIKHQGLKPYRCDICKQGFVSKCNLENHQWQHRGERSRPFKCQLCNKAYLRSSLLEAHMRSHKGIKPFVCNECGIQFSNKCNWQRHVSEHSGLRNFECPRCDKKFSRKYYLTDHMKVHTGEKPFSCGICGKTAATRSNYNSHLRTHITREPVNSEV